MVALRATFGDRVMPRLGQENEGGIRHLYDRDASMKKAILRLTHENQRLKALVVTLSELVIKNVVATKSDEDTLRSRNLD
jgi:hypothetical protein